MGALDTPCFIKRMFPSQLASIDCTNEAKMKVFGAKLLQHAILSEGIELLHYYHLPAQLPTSTSEQHLILINTNVSPDTYVEQVTEGKIQTAQMRLGDVIIVPAQLEASANWNQAHSYLALCFNPIVLEQKVHEMVKGYSVELLPQFALPDSLIHSIVLALQQELSTPGFGGKLYLDSLVTTLCTHLLRHYCIQKPINILPSSLPPATLNRVIDYIQVHLAEDLTLTQLAAIAKVSPNYFAAQFKQSMGITPHKYVIQQRIAKAKELIIAGKGTLAEISNYVGFADQSHFTHHFKRMIGVTPKKFLMKQ